MGGGNGSDCVWALAIADRWWERSAGVSAPPTFVKYTVFPTLAPDADEYARPVWVRKYVETPGSGFSLPVLLPVKFDVPLGKFLTLTLTDFTQPTTSDSFVPVQVGSGFASSLASCNNTDEPVTIGDRLNIDAA